MGLMERYKFSFQDMANAAIALGTSTNRNIMLGNLHRLKKGERGGQSTAQFRNLCREPAFFEKMKVTLLDNDFEELQEALAAQEKYANEPISRAVSTHRFHPEAEAFCTAWYAAMDRLGLNEEHLREAYRTVTDREVGQETISRMAMDLHKGAQLTGPYRLAVTNPEALFDALENIAKKRFTEKEKETIQKAAEPLALPRAQRNRRESP